MDYSLLSKNSEWILLVPSLPLDTIQCSGGRLEFNQEKPFSFRVSDKNDEHFEDGEYFHNLNDDNSINYEETDSNPTIPHLLKDIDRRKYNDGTIVPCGLRYSYDPVEVVAGEIPNPLL